MPTYRYMGVDILTRQIIEDLPLYGVSLQRRISAAGSMTGSYKLGTGEFSDDDLLNGSTPGLRALYVLRDNVLIWAGPIWTRTYQSQASVVSMTGQTYESAFSQFEMLSRFKNVKVDQMTVFKNLIDMMQAQDGMNIGLDTSQIGTSGTLVDLTVEAYEHRMFSAPIEDLLKAANSFDYVIDHSFDPTTEQVSLTVKTGFPYLGYGQAGIDLDYPGSITNYWYPESAGRGTVRLTAIGAGSGSAMPVAVYVNQDLRDAGYPAWSQIRAEKGVRNKDQISRIAMEAALTNKMPVSNPTVEFNLDEATDFADWTNLGVPVNMHVEDPRFPSGRDFSVRMIGWDYTPESSENSEGLRVQLEGGDAV